MTKDDQAKNLAQSHFELDDRIEKIIRIYVNKAWASDEPIILLEVNADTIETGITPLHFAARLDPSPTGLTYPVTIIEVTPNEYRDIEAGKLPLPVGFTLGEEIPRPVKSIDDA